MTSILTNASAMLALQTLKMTNKNLDQVQSELSTGKKIASAKDNAATWSIATVMDSDIGSFKAIADSLNLGQATIAVARSSSEQITDLLTQMKEKIVSAQEENVDRDKIQADIDALREQVSSIVDAAQFNGLNLIDGSNATVSVLSSLNRASDGTVSASHIDVTAQDLSTVTGALTTGTMELITVSSGTYASANVSGVLNAAETGTIDFTNLAANLSGDGGEIIRLTVGGKTAQYTTQVGDDATSLVSALKSAFQGLYTDPDGANTGVDPDFSFAVNAGDSNILDITNNTADDAAVAAVSRDAATGGLGMIGNIDVSGNAYAQALIDIESAITVAVDAAASFGSSQSRLEVQSTFVSEFIDAMTTGVGALVDADMEASAARLQALQVQQQLGLQALSIANSAPQNILSLFR